MIWQRPLARYSGNLVNLKKKMEQGVAYVVEPRTTRALPRHTYGRPLRQSATDANS